MVTTHIDKPHNKETIMDLPNKWRNVLSQTTEN